MAWIRTKETKTKQIPYVLENFSSMNAEVSLCNGSSWIQLQAASVLDEVNAASTNLLHGRLDPTSHLTHTAQLSHWLLTVISRLMDGMYKLTEIN